MVSKSNSLVGLLGKIFVLLFVLIFLGGCVLENISINELKVSSNNSSYGTVTGGGVYDEDTKVSIQALPHPGYIFIRWSDNNTEATRTIIVPSGGATYTAYFERGTIVFNETFEEYNWESNTSLYAESWNKFSNPSNYSSWNSFYASKYNSYGLETNEPYTPNSGSKILGCNGSYKSYKNTSLAELKRTVYLSSFSSATLRFHEWINTEVDNDFLNIYIKGQNGDLHKVYSNSGSHIGWAHREVTLDDYTGQTIELIFQFISNSSVIPSGYAGVWLDNIVISAQ